MPLARIALLATLPLLLLPAAADAQKRIVGGGPTAPGAYPAQAHLRIDLGAASLSCGGTLISRTKVATAAHCLDAANYALPLVVPRPVAIAPERVTVSLGSDLAGQGDRQVASAVQLHPDYDPRTSANDAAVITLPQPATQQPLSVVDPAVDAASYATGRPAVVIGWGRTTDGGQASARLLEVEVPVVSDADCNDANSYAGSLLVDVMLCAGLPEGGKDSCQGDSGGPLMTRSTGVLKLAGIVSFGDGCAAPQKYGVYTEVGAAAIQGFLATAAGAPPKATVDAVTGAVAGRATTVRVSASDPTPGGGIAAVAWDLDGDGAFDDATGLSAPWIPTAAGDQAVRARVSDSDGMVVVAERVVTVAARGSEGTAASPSVSGASAGSTPAGSTPAGSPPAGSATATTTTASGVAAAGGPASQSGAAGTGSGRARLATVSARGVRGTLRLRGTVTGTTCRAARVRVTVTRSGRRVARRTVAVDGRCAFGAALRLRGRLTIGLELLQSDGTVTRLGSRTRRVS
ncbi:serine protease [Paraconexibacter algicola]|uniref:Peptidase S1 domain-containing protein n=1 Tax=Paraconexibacter algicola TaxID=2133960 RepID=A0A2T4UDC4_9ACTN|nr:trypsin-like serine protease [Paraconexibacter algicola]PTL55510.1 hypothetical protein C7Y72_17830 [Paraconexibacter algicola]